MPDNQAIETAWECQYLQVNLSSLGHSLDTSHEHTFCMFYTSHLASKTLQKKKENEENLRFLNDPWKLTLIHPWTGLPFPFQEPLHKGPGQIGTNGKGTELLACCPPIFPGPTQKYQIFNKGWRFLDIFLFFLQNSPHVFNFSIKNHCSISHLLKAYYSSGKTQVFWTCVRQSRA